LEQAFDQVLGFEAPGGADPARQVAIRARDRVGESFETFITERGASPAEQDTAAFLLASANQLILAGDLLVVIAGAMGYAADRSAAGAREVRGQVQILLGAYGRLADELSLSRAPAPESQVSMASVRQAELNCLRHWQDNPDVGRGAMAVVMAGEWVQNLAYLEADLEGVVNTTAEAAQRPWWR